MNSSRKLLPLTQLCMRSLNRTAAQSAAVEERPSSKFNRLKNNQKKFQVEDGVPVYLKGGAGDKILFQASTILIAVGLGMSFKVFWDLTLGKQ